jgi:hydrogenase maturation factor HypF (carbamoyltransferase family)
MDMNLEREYCIDNMSETLFATMKTAMQEDRNEDAIAICEEWLVDGKDPQDTDYEYIFMNNTTFGDWTWEVK